MTSELPPVSPASPDEMWAGSYALPQSPRSPALARMLVRQALTNCPDVVVESALLLVSELVTNAVRHAETDLILHITLAPELRIAVEDASSDLVSGPLAPSDGDGGRGMTIVEALATSWGWERTVAGKQIWFEL